MQEIAFSELPFELQTLSLTYGYQDWVIDSIRSSLGSRILELGAGIGTMSQHLITHNCKKKELLYLTEGDPKCFQFLSQLVEQKKTEGLPFHGELLDLNSSWVGRLSSMNFDTVVSFNVMEHIENDLEAFQQQYLILKKSKTTNLKKIIAFTPAHPFLFGTLDKTFLHFRRYHHSRVQKIFQTIDPSCTVSTRYFNTLGALGWLWLGRVLKKDKLGLSSVNTFEKIIPFVRNFDDFIHVKLHFPFGQSLISIITL